MNIIHTAIKDLVIIEPQVFADGRGFFCETYNEQKYFEAGIGARFVQDNMSKSSFGVVRGLHYQLAPHSQGKLVSVVEGAVWDVAVDLRRESPTFAQWFAVELTAENHRQFFIPQGFAHGFSVLSKTAVFTYKCTDFYSPSLERGIIYNDPALKIDWKIPENAAVISEKDLKHPTLKFAEMNF
ncbi:MAG: dTDP-4-dehydrorhamnose 3,5-epimerase [Prevotellaceae bacterium]|jgi:dTDP-4-dehydrorhamnose 3,5-epimerase|nr:dTDP-4-dehydrorhamnose 3,5-epimerase [Prevotellaceae bacterium]